MGGQAIKVPSASARTRLHDRLYRTEASWKRQEAGHQKNNKRGSVAERQTMGRMEEGGMVLIDGDILIDEWMVVHAADLTGLARGGRKNSIGLGHDADDSTPPKCSKRR